MTARIGIALLGALAYLCLSALAGPFGTEIERVSAEVGQSESHEGAIGSAEDVDWYPLFALAGRTYALTLERITLPRSALSIWKPSAGAAPPRMVAQASSDGVPLIWTAPQSGAWRVRVAGRQSAVGEYRLMIGEHQDVIGADLTSARLSAFAADGTLVERSSIDNGGDVDWFAFPVAAGNRYLVWSLTGSAPSLAARVREPAAESFRELGRKGDAFSDLIEVSDDGLAVIAVRGRESWMLGSYAFGVTRLGSAPEPNLSLPPRLSSRLRIRSIDAVSGEGEARFRFSGEWGPISANSGLRVWIDTNPGAGAREGEDDDWEFLLRSNDGRRASIWSFAEKRWIGSVAVQAQGFETLVLPWSGRTAEERIRWQASVKNSGGDWTVSRPALLRVPDPTPALPQIWPTRELAGSEDPRWARELEAAGVAAGIEDGAIVVALDAGHGVDTGAWDNRVREADSNLAFALRVEELLEAEGVSVVQTRRAAGRPYLNLDHTPGNALDGVMRRADLRVRAELAHLAGADVFVSIHSNANYNTPASGLEAWYLPRWNGDGENQRLSDTILAHVRGALADYGYPTTTLSYDATCWEIVDGRCDPIYVLAPFLLIDADAAQRWRLDPAALGLSDDPWAPPSNDWLWRSELTRGDRPIDLIDRETQIGPGKIVRGNLMPTTLLELLYITDEDDARILRDPAARERIAQATADGILEFLGLVRQPG